MCRLWEKKSVLPRRSCSCVARQPCYEGFTLIELLVVISIISTLMAILLPALSAARRQVCHIRNMNNQRQVVCAVNEYAVDNESRYPESVAAIGVPGSTDGDDWHWQSPTMLMGYSQRSPQIHLSLSAYLRSYLEEANVIFCPSAPEEYKFLQDAWEAGDEWDIPYTPVQPDAVYGTYCLYWNYTGCLENDRIFRGPKVLMGGRGQSELLISDYFGFGHWRSPEAYGSCQQLPKADVTPGTDASSAYWSMGDSELDRANITLRLHAGYTDGHVERYSPTDTVPMMVSLRPDGSEPYPSDFSGSPGTFFLPDKALQ